MRELTNHKTETETVRVFVLDEQGQGGAHHRYVVCIPFDGEPFYHPAETFQDAMNLNEKQEEFKLLNGSTLSYLESRNLAHISGENPQYYKVQKIDFQNGPVKENKFNGNTNEALLSIIIDRMECFQKGKFSCLDNQNSLDYLNGAMVWMLARTKKRELRHVEGTCQP